MARAFGIGSGAPGGAGSPSHIHQEDNPRLVAYEKLLRELGNNSTIGSRSTTDGRDDSERTVTEIATEGLVSASRLGYGERSRGPRYETDGGTRLAGGRPGEVVADDFDRHSTSEGSALPPPYSSDFGET